MKDVNLEIGGMHCVMCAAAVERALNKLDGVESASVSYASESASVCFDESRVSVRDMEKCVKQAGYRVLEDRALAQKREFRSLLWSFVISLVLSLPFFIMMPFMFFWPHAPIMHLLHNGWLLTGDMAREDEDGFIYLVDRAKDVIISGGENLYPVQIEDFLRRNDAIKDVAVIGLPDHRLGEIAAAIIELKPDRQCTEEEINDFCLDLPRYKRPRRIIFAEVPRNPTGKIEKPKLRERYCGENLVEAQTRE